MLAPIDGPRHRATKFVTLVTLCVAAFGARADPKPLGAWLHTTDPPLFAATTNDSGNVFGQRCDPDGADGGACEYILAISTRCEIGALSAVLINADNGSAAARVRCTGPLPGGDLFQYVLGSFDDVDKAVRNSQRIGIAFPLEGDQFRVFRFSLDGASSSIALMRSAAERTARSKAASTRDQKL